MTPGHRRAAPRRRRRGAGLAGLAVVVATACGPAGTRASPPLAASADRPDGVRAAAHPSVFYDERSFAVARRRAGPARPAPGALGVIVPHHWLAGHLILQGLRDAGTAPGGIRRVVLLAPNHIGATGAPVITSDRAWDTPQGRVEPDTDAVAAFVAAGHAVVAPRAIGHEHAVAGLMPAIAAELPGARVVPLALSGIDLAAARRLAGAITPLLDGRTVVVASVDFSHYLPPEQAEARDAETLATLRALDAAAVVPWGNDHLDSPGAVATLLETMGGAGAGRFELRAHANSAELVGRPPNGVTSYIYGLFRPL